MERKNLKKLNKLYQCKYNKHNKCCFVENCSRNSSVLFSVPTRSRETYIQLCSSKKVAEKKRIYICLDHFDVRFFQ